MIQLWGKFAKYAQWPWLLARLTQRVSFHKSRTFALTHSSPFWMLDSVDLMPTSSPVIIWTVHCLRVSDGRPFTAWLTQIRQPILDCGSDIVASERHFKAPSCWMDIRRKWGFRKSGSIRNYGNWGKKKMSTHKSTTLFEASGDCLRAKCQKWPQLLII